MDFKKNSILIVEDHDSTREGLASFLGGEYTCFAAASAEEAMRLMGARNFNLVLTDINLPGASGLELCRLVRRMSLGTVVIAMTAMTDNECRESALREGALYYIEKPFELDKLLAWIRSALGCQAMARVRRSPEQRTQLVERR
ncbi:MAG TPA: response regulator [Blastocatellia bacterium]|nr:response regulator [Blastocatellia bacterium]